MVRFIRFSNSKGWKQIRSAKKVSKMEETLERALVVDALALEIVDPDEIGQSTEDELFQEESEGETEDEVSAPIKRHAVDHQDVEKRLREESTSS
jgi:hypothetical protein